jgi:peptidoglycan hydrolase-like protein with peptidoglycan-binding domain
MSKLFLISEEEKNRILNLHEYAIKREMVSQKKLVKTLNEDEVSLPEYEGVPLGKVEAVQQALEDAGYPVGPKGVDGKFGKDTRAAVIKYQKDNSITPAVGNVGPITAGKLGVQQLTSSSSGSKKSSTSSDSPFKTREDGNAFRKWMHKNFPADVKKFNLDLEGSHTNDTIKNVFNSKPKGYTTTTYGMYYERTKGQTQQTKTDSTATKKPEISTDPKNRCIAISKEECDKISSTKETRIGKGSETRCSAYMVKCLSQYDSDLFGGNAWDAFNNVKGGGTVKYNLFTSGEVNWTKIWSDLTKNKVSKATCEKHAKTDDADRIVNSIVPSIVTNNIPSSPKFSINSLKLGDIVGLYHKNSSNKGMAFCQRALKRGLDNNGNVSDKDPFTFNSHVGFVGAIKNGVPIVIHNVSGNHMATPATQMLSKTSNDMITWVVSDSSIASAIESGDKASPEKKGYEFSLPKFNFGL